jgi:hypothetical protein
MSIFMFYPERNSIRDSWVLYGKPGDPGFPALLAIDAAGVIDALSDRFPDPKPKG